MERIIMDTDLGVDDTIGIMVALKSQQVCVEGLTLVSSVGDVLEAGDRARKVLKVCDREDVGIYKGSNHPLQREISKVAEFKEDYLPIFEALQEGSKKLENEVAVDYMIRMVVDNPGEITIVAMGPLTNIAIALQKEPMFASKLKGLIICGGTQTKGNCTPVAEFNFWGDPHAAKKVFNAQIHNVTMIGLDATRQIIINQELSDKIKIAENGHIQVIYDFVKERVLKNTYENRLNRGLIDGTLGILYLVNPNIVETKRANVEIETKGISMGQSIVDIEGVWNKGICNCEVAEHVDCELFVETMLSTM